MRYLHDSTQRTAHLREICLGRGLALGIIGVALGELGYANAADPSRLTYLSTRGFMG
jgi:hypothetical protein